MTGILDRIRTTTVADLDKVSGDFSDVAPATYRPRVPREMVRTVEGADDLKVDRPAPKNPGMVRLDGTGTIDTRPYQDEVGLPTERQRAFMDSLLADLKDLDQAVWSTAMEYTCRMSQNRAWDRSKGGNASRWITNLKNKIAELRKTFSPTVAAAGNVQHDEMPKHMTKTGKPRPAYFAVDIEGTTKFYRVKAGTKPGWWWIDVQASEEFHPVRNVATKNAILRAIIAAGAQNCMERYGQLIGSCGRCHITLTDELSRSRGIGPDCWGKM